jgi:hypothetical protein
MCTESLVNITILIKTFENRMYIVHMIYRCDKWGKKTGVFRNFS